MSLTTTQIVRLRECGQKIPRKGLHPVLNVRAIAFKREVKDRFLKFDERVLPRNTAYMCWVEKVDAVQDKKPPHIVEQLENTYKQAMHNIEVAATIRNKRIGLLLQSIKLIKAEIKK